MGHDLHSLLTAARDDAPPPRLSVDDITAAGRHLVRRRRRLTLLSSIAGGAVAAVAAVTIALVMASPSIMTPALDPSRLPAVPSTPKPTAFTDAMPFVTTYQGYDAGPYKVTDPDLVTTAYQQSTIEPAVVAPVPSRPELPPTSGSESGSAPAPGFASDSPSAMASAIPRRDGLVYGGTLVVYRGGAFTPREFSGGEKIVLRSGAGLLNYAGGVTGPSMSPDELKMIDKYAGGVPALTWRYSGDAWAAIYWSTWESVPTRDELVAIADGLAPAAPKPFPVGFQVKSAPKGYTLLSASFGQDLRTGDQAVSAVRLSMKPPSLPIAAPFDFDQWPTLTLSLGHVPAGKKMVLDKPVCDGSGTLCNRFTGDGTVYLQAELNNAKMTGAVQPSQILLALAPEDLASPATWPPAVKIFP